MEKENKFEGIQEKNMQSNFWPTMQNHGQFRPNSTALKLLIELSHDVCQKLGNGMKKKQTFFHPHFHPRHPSNQLSLQTIHPYIGKFFSASSELQNILLAYKCQCLTQLSVAQSNYCKSIVTPTPPPKKKPPKTKENQVRVLVHQRLPATLGSFRLDYEYEIEYECNI